MRSCILTWVFLLGCALSTASADSLKGELLTKTVLMRGGGISQLELQLQWAGGHILEGRVEAEILGDGQVVVRVRSAELVIPQGTRKVSLMVPPIDTVGQHMEFAVRLRMLEKDKTWELGSFPILDAGMGRNNLVLAVVRTGQTPSLVEPTLRLETLSPGFFAQNPGIRTAPIKVEVEDLPIRTLDYCRFDTVYLDGPSFAATKEKQLTALRRWVEGGGSVCVWADIAISPEHVNFLKELTEGTVEFPLDETGRLQSQENQILQHRTGLGRAIIVTTPATKDFLAENEWKSAVGFLWKLQPRSLAHLETEGTWDPATVEKQFQSSYYYRNYWTSTAEGLTNCLWRTIASLTADGDEALRTIPLSTIVLTLVLLLLVVGPGDYLVLGWLRRHRWTWILFPLVCGAFTWGMVILAGKYLGHQDRTQLIRIVDLGRDGRVLREIRYENFFPARDNTLRTEMKNGLAFPIPSQMSMYGRATIESLPPTNEWQINGGFTLEQPVRQWMPVLNRVTNFSEGKDDSDIPWEDCQKKMIRGSPIEITTVNPTRSYQFAFLNEQVAEIHSNSNNRVEWWLWLLCSETPGTLGRLVTQRSPQLGGGFGDLNTEQTTGALIAWRREGRELHIYRHPLIPKVSP